MPSTSKLALALDRLVQRLTGGRAQLLTAVAAGLLAATSVGPHRALDDYVLSLIARGRGTPLGLDRGTLDLFTFTTGDPENNRRLMDAGLMLPWWTDERLRIAFFRPLSSLTHWLDEKLFPGSPALMHAHSLLWFLALLLSVLLLYRRLEPAARLSGLAFFLYALDDAHGPALAWLANRNALIAASFGCLTLLAHDVWRRNQSLIAAALAAGALVAGLLAGELAVGALAYVAAYAVFMERGAPLKRVLSVTPYLMLILAWRLIWVEHGFGARGSGAYIDPLGDPIGFLRVLPEKLIVMLHGQFSAPPSDLAFLGPPAHRKLFVVLSALTLGVVGFLLSPVVRRDRSARFWALGMLLSLVPLAATFPSDRLLLFAGLGAMALLARLFDQLICDAKNGALRLGLPALLTCGLLLLHGLVAPLLLPIRAAQMEIFGRAHDRAAAGIPSGPDAPELTVVVIKAPVVLFTNYVQAQRELAGVPRPEHLYLLATGSSPLSVERSGTASITIRPADGFLHTPLDRHYRGAPASLRVGQRVVLSGLTAEITARRADGRPETVEFTFTRAPERYRFVSWRNGRFQPFELPAPGQGVSLPAEDLGKILLGAALGGF